MNLYNQAESIHLEAYSINLVLWQHPKRAGFFLSQGATKGKFGDKEDWPHHPLILMHLLALFPLRGQIYYDI